MVNYSLGKIYKIVDNTNDNIYIGSTCEKKLARRLAKHRSDYNTYLNKNGYYITSFEILKNNNYEIVLIELYPCNSKDELFARERYYIENTVCINKYIPIRNYTDNNSPTYEQDINSIKLRCKKYRENNPKKEQERHKIYYDKNKEELMKTIICECGCAISKQHLPRHKRTIKHNMLMEELNNININVQIESHI